MRKKPNTVSFDLNGKPLIVGKVNADRLKILPGQDQPMEFTMADQPKQPKKTKDLGSK